MAAYLEIVWDGIVPGLTDRRLSLEAFGPALRELVAAVRRIASDLEMQARGPALERRHGRLAREAANLDVQIETIQANSPITLKCAVVPIEEPARPLIVDLPDQAVDVFLRDLERESRGQLAHYRVRRFLKALPSGLSEQKYRYRSSDGELRREVQIAAMALAEATQAPHLVELDGVLVGVGFEQGKSEIKLRALTGELVSLSATPDQVERAIELRLQSVQALAVAEPSKTRLLRLAVEPATAMPPDERARFVFATWGPLLELLAR